MAVGYTTTGSLADSLPTVIASARATREYEGRMSQLVRKVSLDLNTGLTWNEALVAALTATRVTETTKLDNPQQLSDTLVSITPTVIGIHVVITRRTKARISKETIGQMGGLGQSAIQRLKDEDGITVLGTGATTCSPGAGNVLTPGHISAAKSNLSSNTTEPANPPFYGVLHGFQIHDLHDALVAGVGTYPIGEGPTARVFGSGFKLPIADVTVYEDGNITIDSSDDATGGVFAKEGIILVQGLANRVETDYLKDLGGGADVMYIYDEYAYGLGNSTTWVQTIVSDAVAPTA